MKSTRGVTLLEMIVAATILAIAVVGLMAGLSGTTRNAARLQDYDRAVQLGPHAHERPDARSRGCPATRT